VQLLLGAARLRMYDAASSEDEKMLIGRSFRHRTNPLVIMVGE